MEPPYKPKIVSDKTCTIEYCVLNTIEYLAQGPGQHIQFIIEHEYLCFQLYCVFAWELLLPVSHDNDTNTENVGTVCSWN